MDRHAIGRTLQVKRLDKSILNCDMMLKSGHLIDNAPEGNAESCVYAAKLLLLVAKQIETKYIKE